MGLLTISKKVYLPGGHHRQPRNTNSSVQVGPTETYTDPTSVNRTADPSIFFDLNGKQAVADFLFWSFTDGTAGQTQTDLALIQPVGPGGLTVTAWYYPQGGGSGQPGNAIIDDAFSAKLGDFIDDTFVTVTSDPSLTNDANVVGVVPTANPETLKANASVPSTGEPFKKWMSFGAGTPVGDTLDVPAGANGLAFAVYEKDVIAVPPLGKYGIYVRPSYGVLVDAGGPVWGPNGPGDPVGPWGPLVSQLMKLSVATAGAQLTGGRFSSHVTRLAAAEAVSAIKAAMPAIQETANAKIE